MRRQTTKPFRAQAAEEPTRLAVMTWGGAWGESQALGADAVFRKATGAVAVWVVMSVHTFLVRRDRLPGPPSTYASNNQTQTRHLRQKFSERAAISRDTLRTIEQGKGTASTWRNGMPLPAR